jgi:hypothetical protein
MSTKIAITSALLRWSSLLFASIVLVSKGEKTSIDIYRRLKKTHGPTEPSLLYYTSPDGNRLLYQAPIDFHTELKSKDSNGIGGSMNNNIDPACWISSFLILDQARLIVHEDVGQVKLLNNTTSSADRTDSIQKLSLSTKPGSTTCAMLEHHDRKVLALEMTRCYMEEHKYLFQELIFHSSSEEGDAVESFDISQCYDSNAIYSSPYNLQKCIQYMDDVGFLTYTQLLILLDGICSKWSRPLWDYVLMDSTMKMIGMFQSLEQQQSRQNLSQVLINATEQLLLLQSSSIPEEDLLVINEHERIRKAYQHMSNILELANRLKKIFIRVIQWYALLKLSGTISLIHYFGPLCAVTTISLVVFVISQIYRCLSCRRVPRKIDEDRSKNDTKNEKKVEMQILLNQREHHKIVQAHLEEFLMIQLQRKQAQQGIPNCKDCEDTCQRYNVKKKKQVLKNQPQKRAVNDEHPTIQVEPKTIVRNIRDLESKCHIGSYNHEDLVATNENDKQKKKNIVEHLSVMPVLDSVRELSTYMPIISPEQYRQLVVEEPIFSDRSTLSNTTDFEFHSMEELDDSSADYLSVPAGSRKRCYSEDTIEREINETGKRLKSSRVWY